MTMSTPYGQGPIQTRSDDPHGSKYAGCFHWETVTEAYQAWLSDGSIFRFTWWERLTRSPTPGESSVWKITDYDHKKVGEEKGCWKHRCFIPVTREQLAKWSPDSLRDVFQVFPKFGEVHPETNMFIDQDLYKVFPKTDHHPIHEVLTEDQFLRRYCREYYNKMMYERETRQMDKERETFLKRETEKKERVKEEARVRREAKEAERMAAEQKLNRGEVEKPKEETKKKRRGRRGGKGHKKNKQSEAGEAVQENE